MTAPPTPSWRGRFRLRHFRLRHFRRRHPDPFALMAFVGALMIAAAFALTITRPAGGGGAGGTASLDASGAARDEFAAPVAMPANGEYVRSRVLPSGDLAVDHWIQSTNLIWQLTLTVPRALRSTGKDVIASRVRVSSDGVAQFGPTTVMRKEIYHPQGASKLRVSYVLSGALVRSGSTPRRALLRATSLNLAYTLDRGPRVVSVTGAKVLAAACTPPNGDTEASARPCGSAQGQAWKVRLEPQARRYGVLAQLDLI